MSQRTIGDRLGSVQSESDDKGRKLNPLDLIHKYGHPVDAMLYSELFWPRFREFADMVFLADMIEDQEDEERVMVALERLGTMAEVERSFNTLEVPLLFGKSAGYTTEDENMLLAEKLKEMWSARLARQFRTREFEVYIVPSDENVEVSVGFFQKRRS